MMFEKYYLKGPHFINKGMVLNLTSKSFLGNVKKNSNLLATPQANEIRIFGSGTQAWEYD